MIRGEDIISRELVLVIPKNELSGANEQLLQDMVHTAASKGITLVVERYGTKVIEGENAEEEESGEADEEADEGEDGSDQGGNDVDSEAG